MTWIINKCSMTILSARVRVQDIWNWVWVWGFWVFMYHRVWSKVCSHLHLQSSLILLQLCDLSFLKDLFFHKNTSCYKRHNYICHFTTYYKKWFSVHLIQGLCHLIFLSYVAICSCSFHVWMKLHVMNWLGKYTWGLPPLLHWVIVKLIITFSCSRSHLAFWHVIFDNWVFLRWRYLLFHLKMLFTSHVEIFQSNKFQNNPDKVFWSAHFKRATQLKKGCK